MTDRYPFLLRMLAGQSTVRLSVDAAEFERRMCRLFGLWFIDDGLFSRVYAVKRRDDVVVKINAGSQGVDGWLAYASFLRGHQDNPHAPRIHAIRTFVGSDGVRGYIAVMERLAATVREVSEDGAWNERLGASKVTSIIRQREAARMVLNYGRERAQGMPETLERFVYAIQEAFEGIFDFDLHDRNAMIREDGTLVITDPLSFQESAEAVENLNALFAA